MLKTFNTKPPTEAVFFYLKSPNLQISFQISPLIVQKTSNQTFS
nr:MAG TPA: hypothetical protein [Bacteriophage sp.]